MLKTQITDFSPDEKRKLQTIRLGIFLQHSSDLMSSSVRVVLLPRALSKMLRSFFNLRSSNTRLRI